MLLILLKTRGMKPFRESAKTCRLKAKSQGITVAKAWTLVKPSAVKRDRPGKRVWKASAKGWEAMARAAVPGGYRHYHIENIHIGGTYCRGQHFHRLTNDIKSGVKSLIKT